MKLYFFVRSENKSYMINARDMAPLEAHEEMFVSNPSLATKG
jgi:hypothetical protein